MPPNTIMQTIPVISTCAKGETTSAVVLAALKKSEPAPTGPMLEIGIQFVIVAEPGKNRVSIA